MRDLLQLKNVLLVVTLTLGMSLSAQNFTAIGNAMKNGNSSELGKYLDANVELTILNTEAVYSKSQAEMVLKNFYNSNKPNAYKVVHNGDSGSGAKYQIGELSTSTGTYRTYIYAKNKNGVMQVQEIRIEKN